MFDREKMYRYGRSTAHFSRLYDYLKDYYVRHKLHASDLDCFERINKALGWSLCITIEESNRINVAIEETQKFLEGKGYFKFGNLSKYFADMEVLISYAKREIFDDKRRINFTREMEVLIYIYVWIFICEEDLFSMVDSEECKYFLLGKLLLIAGLEEYDEADSSYEDEADYYYRALKIREIKDKNEKIEKTTAKYRWKNEDLVYKKRICPEEYEKDFVAMINKCKKKFIRLEKPIFPVEEFGLFIEAKDFYRIRTTIDEIRTFFEDRGHFKYGIGFQYYLPYMEMLVIFAKKCVFNMPEYSDEYIDGIIDLVILYYYKIIVDWEFLSEVESDEFNYLLLGRLLVIAGFEEYNKDNRSYEDEADYYYKALNIKEIVETIAEEDA